MTPDDIATVGRALYGPLWQEQLARDIGINSRNLRYWLSGARKPRSSEAMRSRLLDLLAAREAILRAARTRLEG